MSRPNPERIARALTIGGVIAMALGTALAGCAGSKSTDDQGTSTLPTGGTVLILGTFALGQTLSALPTGFTLGTPAGSYHFVWQRCADAGCSSTTGVGTDSATYTLAATDAGFYVRAGVYASNSCASGCGSSETAYSAATIVPGILPSQGTVSISGTFAIGEPLTAVPSGFTFGTPAGSYHYVWQRCADAVCASMVEVGTDSATYTLEAADVGFYVRAGVYASNSCASGCGSSETAYSAASVLPGTPPTAGNVSLSGSVAVGEMLTAVPSGFTLGMPAGSYHYAWQRCFDSNCSTVAQVGIDSAMYTLTADDVGFLVWAGVHASNECISGCGSSATAYSESVVIPGTLPSAGTVTISGTWALYETLTAVPYGFTLGTPTGSYYYVWQRCLDPGCASTTDVGTDSETYTLGTDDFGFYVRVGVYTSNMCNYSCGPSATAYSASMTIPDLEEWAAWPMPDSATVFCTDGNATISCSITGTGQDGDYLINTPSYTTTEYTVLDNVTGLRWSRYDWTGTWDEAWRGCDGLNADGYVGWRLPTYIELLSIVDFGRWGPAIDVSAFLSTRAGNFHWSTSRYAADKSKVWGVDFISGEGKYGSTVDSNPYRCVR